MRNSVAACSWSSLRYATRYTSTVILEPPPKQQTRILQGTFENQLWQLRVLRSGLLKDGDVGVGVFPKSKEILIGSSRPCEVARERIGTSTADVRQREVRITDSQVTVLKNALEFG